ncbi:MAG: hypothetical protein PHF61_10280 [Bacteroidales bacterium]|nr:hypothetical protein [Bacteroidales bacterium]
MTEDLFLGLMFLVMMLIMAIYIGSFLLLIKFKRERENKKRNKKAFYRAFKAGLNNNTIKSFDDLKNLYLGISGKSKEDLEYYRDLTTLLREFLVDITSLNPAICKNDPDLNIEFDEKKIADWNAKISTYIKTIDELAPYADLPNAERNILNDISCCIGSTQEKIISSKLLELAGIIKTRNDDLNWSKKINRWTIPLTIVGVILTVIFGILALMK